MRAPSSLFLSGLRHFNAAAVLLFFLIFCSWPLVQGGVTSGLGLLSRRAPRSLRHCWKAASGGRPGELPLKSLRRNWRRRRWIRHRSRKSFNFFFREKKKELRIDVTFSSLLIPVLSSGFLKVGAAQKWFDELDNLAFSSAPDGSTMQDQENGAAKNAVDSNSVHVDCAVNTSPGTSEVSQRIFGAWISVGCIGLTSDRLVRTQVVISAVLYLKLKEAGGCLGSQVRESARRVLSLEEKSEHEACVDLLLESHEDVRDVVFMKPLRLRIRLDCGDHPPATTSKELLPTDCKLEVNVSLI